MHTHWGIIPSLISGTLGDAEKDYPPHPKVVPSNHNKDADAHIVADEVADPLVRMSK